MPNRSRGPIASIAPSTAGRLAALFLFAGAAVATANGIAAAVAGHRTGGEFVGAATAGALGLAARYAPWDRWHPRATLVLLAPGLALLAIANYTDPEGYAAGVFFVLIGIWVGLCHPRYTTLALGPVVALAFGLPLALAHAAGNVGEATAIVTGVSVFAGEVLARQGVRLRAAQRELLDVRERRFAALAQGASEVAIIFDAVGQITYVSPGSENTFGYDPADILQMTVLEFMTHHVDQEPRENWTELLGETEADAARAEITETRVRHRDGHWIDVEAVGQDRTEDPDIRGFVYNIRDISSRKQLERRLERHAFFDELTGLPNRAHFLAKVGARIARGEPLAILFIDLDGFKKINDSVGHEVGDQLLQHVADRLRRHFGDPALLARFGSDEFAAVIATDDIGEAHESATQLLRRLQEPFRIGLRTLSITASIGVAVNDSPELDGEHLVRAADTAMYVAKAHPSDHVVAYEPAMRERLVLRLNTEAEIREAIDRHEFEVHYQPIIELATGIPSACEALVRWRHPSRGLLSPAAFIDVAEDSGLIVPLGRWVLRQACRDAASWRHIGSRAIKVAVNVSARQFQDADFVDDVGAALRAAGLDPGRLKVEVTESVLLSDVAPALTRLETLRDIGALLALDDFGTGYSSLSYLQQLPFDVLKIDKAFVDHIASRPKDLALIRTINQLGHDLGLETVAEGIETKDQEKLVRALGVDYGQGFLYSPPLPREPLERFLDETADELAVASAHAPLR